MYVHSFSMVSSVQGNLIENLFVFLNVPEDSGLER